MVANLSKIGGILLTAGLLVVLAQGLWELPDLQNYLFSDVQLKRNLQSAEIETHKIATGMTTLRDRVSYLQWFLAQRDQGERVSMDWVVIFPFSEIIRPLSPQYFWRVNWYLAQRLRVKNQRKLKYMHAFLRYLDTDLRLRSSLQTTDSRPSPPAEAAYLQQIHKLGRRCTEYNSQLNKLTEQLTRLEHNGYKGQDE